MILFDGLREKYKPNLGTFDRLLRTIIAVALLVSVFLRVIYGWFIVFPIVAAIYLILTGDIGFSPLYRLLGWSTTKEEPLAGEK